MYMKNSEKKSAGLKANELQTEANLAAIIEHAEGLVYSIDTEFRYIALNGALKRVLKDLFGLDARPGDKVFEFLEKDEPGEARAWKQYYERAFKGERLKFVKEFKYTGKPEFWCFHINPIAQQGEITGLACFARDITEIHHAQSALRALNSSLEDRVAERTAQLEEANRQLEAFSYMVAHDLKSPLRVINGFINLVINSDKHCLSEESQGHLELVQKNARQMSDLVSDLLEFSRSKKKQLNLGTVEMRPLVEEVIELIKQGEQELRGELKIACLAPCQGDRSLLKLVWMNLISNAVKYTGKTAEPVIEIGSEEKDNVITYYVKDNGIGFDMSRADKLFNPFHRMHAKADFEGTGVGLALVHRIITRHGGAIWAASEVNKGAEFYFNLPVAGAKE